MRGLLRRLADLDGEAERGVAVVEFFDQLLLHRADLESLVRATATLAGCSTGAVDDQLGHAYRLDLDTNMLHEGYLKVAAWPMPACRADISVGDDRVGQVWLECGDDSPWQDLILERMAITAASIHERIRAAHANDSGGFADPGVVELLLGRGTSEVDRARAAGLLGLTHDTQLRAVAVSAAGALTDGLAVIRGMVAVGTGGRVVSAALTAQLGVLLVAGTDPPVPAELPDGFVAGVGSMVTADTADRSWREARRAVRFAGMSRTWPRWLNAQEIGGALFLADVPPEEALTQPDVAALARAALSPGSDVLLNVLEYFCLSGSIREAAAAAHLHHSSAAYRLDSASDLLDYNVKTPSGRRRAGYALLLWNLHRSGD